MKGATVFRLLCIAALWIIICIWYVDRLVMTKTEINLRTLFPIVASGIIIIVPLYKKYFKNADNGKKNGK